MASGRCPAELQDISISIDVLYYMFMYSISIHSFVYIHI